MSKTSRGCGCIKIPAREKLWFKHWAPHKLTQGRWIAPGENYVSVWFLLYKTVLTCYLLAFYTWNHIDYRQRHGDDWWKYWVYLTHWGYEIFIWTRVLDFVLVVARFISEHWHGTKSADEPKEEKPFLHQTNHFGNQLLWLMTTTSYTMAVLITIAYWCFLYPASGHVPSTEIAKFTNFNEHLVQGVASLLDTVVSASPRRVSHFWTSLVFSACYTAFNIAYILTGGTNTHGQDYVYPILAWKEKPGLAVLTVFGCTVVGFLVHVGFWGLTIGRDKLWSKIHNTEQSEKAAAVEPIQSAAMTKF